MSTEKENEVILIVKVDEEAVEKKIVDLRKQVIGLKNDKEELRKANKAGTISTDEYAKGLTRTNLAINQANKEIRENERTLEKNTQQQKAAAGSLVQMRANLSLLTADYAALSSEERKNAEVGGQLQASIRALSDELKAEESAIGDNRRNVGNYAEAIEQAISGNTNWIGSLRNTAASLKEGKESIGQYIQGLKGTTQGMSTVQKASVGLGLSLKAIGIGLLLQAIAGLIAFLTRMDAGMDKVEQATAALGAGFDALLQTIAPIGEAIVSAFENPLESIKKLTLALLNPLDAIRQLVDGSKKLSEDVATNVGRAASAAVAYTKTLQDLGDEQDGLIKQQAQVSAQVAKALIATKDRSKSERERIKLLDDAGKAEQALSNKVVSIKQRELTALIALQKSKTALQDADRKQLLEAEAAVINAQSDSVQTEQQIQNRRSALIEQETSARKAAADKQQEIRKKAAEEFVAEAERELIVTKQRGGDTLAIEETVIRRRLAAEVLGLAKSSQQRRLLETKANADILALRVEHLADIQGRELSARQSEISATLALTQRGTKEELNLQIEAIRAETRQRQVENQKQLSLRQITAQQFAEKEAEIVLTGQRAIDDARLAFAQGELNRKADLDAKRLQTDIDLGAQTFAVIVENQRRQIEQEEKHQLALLELEDLTGEERLVRQNAIQAKALAAKRDLNQQEIERAKADAVALSEARLSATREGSLNELRARKDLLKKQFEQELANVKLTEAEKAKVRAQYRDQEQKLDEDFAYKLAEQIIQTVSLASDGLSTLFDAQAQAATNALDRQQEAAVRSAGANADLRGRIEETYQKKREALEREAARKRKKIASLENIIQTAQAGTAALKLFAENPVLGAITELLILAKAAANQKLIDAQQFAFGGVYVSDGRGSLVRGPGTGKSDSINARISDGESILNARSTALFYDQLSALNVAGGGRAFPGANDTDVPVLRDFAYGGVPQSNGGNLMDVVTAIKDLNIFVSVTDIDAVKGDMVKAKASGDY